LSALLVAAPSLLYYNTGYAQAGYRFSLDFLPFLLILVAQGTRGQLSKGSILLIAASILMGFFCLVNIHGLYLGWF
jgi:uncharacterized membrane protein